jgi:Sec-independent protein translocase protein TatA
MDLLSSVGSQEILMILLVAVIVIGPAKIMEFGKTMGKISRNIKQTTDNLTADLNREIDLENDEKKKTDSKPEPPKS